MVDLYIRLVSKLFLDFFVCRHHIFVVLGLVECIIVVTKHKVIKRPMNEIFKSQLDETSFANVLTFVVMEESGQETVISWKKNKIEDIPSVYDYVGTEKNRLPRFIRK